MSSAYTLQITSEQAQEIPMVDLAYMILKAANTPFYYRDLLMEIAKVKGITEEEIKEVMAQIYTEINIDGRFACVGKNVWGLKSWYPVEKTEDPVGNTSRPRIINDDDDDELEEEFEEETFDSSFDGESSEFDDDEDSDDLDEDADLDEDDEMDDDFSDDLDEDMDDVENYDDDLDNDGDRG